MRQTAQAVERGHGGGGPVDELDLHSAISEMVRGHVVVFGGFFDEWPRRRSGGKPPSGIFVRRAVRLRLDPLAVEEIFYHGPVDVLDAEGAVVVVVLHGELA